jgi:hypothetical protein
MLKKETQGNKCKEIKNEKKSKETNKKMGGRSRTQEKKKELMHYIKEINKEYKERKNMAEKR